MPEIDLHGRRLDGEMQVGHRLVRSLIVRASTVLASPTMMPPRSAAQNPLTVKPRPRWRETAPVAISSGRRIAFTRPNTAARTRKPTGVPVYARPGTSQTARQSASALMTKRIRCARIGASGGGRPLQRLVEPVQHGVPPQPAIPRLG